MSRNLESRVAKLEEKRAERMESRNHFREWLEALPPLSSEESARARQDGFFERLERLRIEAPELYRRLSAPGTFEEWTMAHIAAEKFLAERRRPDSLAPAAPSESPVAVAPAAVDPSGPVGSEVRGNQPAPAEQAKPAEEPERYRHSRWRRSRNWRAL